MLDDRRIGIAIGDISGKGVGAALMMALALSTIEGQGHALEQPEQLLRAVNQQLSRRLMENRMNAALLSTILDMDRGTLAMADAGMAPPYLPRDGQARRLDTRGFLLGPMPEFEYDVTTIDLLPDDLLLLVSDGIIEARRRDGELFGFKRVSRFLEEHGSNPAPGDLIAALLDHVTRFVDGAEQHDDMTIIVPQPNLAPLGIGRRAGHAREVVV